ncbi:hypothetical protein [Amycolatopsis albispora]|uniref:hypothetical protein n=1 Tax=Amycolatopsis albispora TaxID=1804986 RepID=UPI000DE491B5|nr:hypothetical protein [Amycolatopsis albispora]
MPFADKIQPAPREVRFAGALTAIPGLASVVIAVVLLVTAFGAEGARAGNIYAEAGYYAVLGAGTMACGIGLLLGHTWARSPSVVVALMVAGIGWYSAGPSGRPGFGVPLIIGGLVVVVLLFRRPSRAWVLGMAEGEDEAEASERDAERRRRGGREA